MAWAIIGVTAITAVSSGAKIYSANKAADKAEDLAIEAKKEEDAQKELLKVEMDKYKSHKFKNPYADLSMENFAEDITVNQQQAQFQAQQGAQTRSNIMAGMRGAAGGSGIAALAQAMANQGQLATQQISASIGMQEQANEKLKIAGAERVAGVELQKATGDAMVASAEMGRMKTLIGMQQASTAGAMDYSNQADAYQMQADNALTSAWSSGIAGTIGAGVGGITGGLGRMSGGTSGSVGGLGLEGGGFSDAGFGREIDGGISGPTLGVDGELLFKDLSKLSILKG